MTINRQKLRQPSPSSGGCAEALHAFPSEVIPPRAGEMSAAPTKGARLREKKVARLYAATDEVEKTDEFILLVVVCETETYATNILRKHMVH